MEKLSYAHTPSKATYMYQTIPERVRCLASEQTSLPAFISYDNAGKRRAITRQELYEQPVSLAKNLTELGERSGSVVECLTRDRRAAGSSLTGVTALWSLSKTHLS